MKNKGLKYLLLLFWLILLAVIFPSETDTLTDESGPSYSTTECTVGTHNNSNFSHLREPFHSACPILVDKRKGCEKYTIKSLSKLFKLYILDADQPVTAHVVQDYYLHNLYIPHNATLSQLQTFII